MLLAAAVFSAALSAVLAAKRDAGGGCTLDLNTQLIPSKEPLIFESDASRDQREKLDWIWPQVEGKGQNRHGVLHIEEGKKLLFACPGKDNAIKASGKVTASGVCSGGKLTVNGKRPSKENLSCKTDVAASYAEGTQEPCGKGDHVGTKFFLGFKLPDEQKQFFPLVEVCHNIEKMVTYYTHHELLGKSIDGAVHSKQRRTFRPEPRSEGVFRGTDPDKDYSQKGQNVTLELILGEGAGGKYTIKDLKYIARGHLSPDADFIYNSGQQMTYYFINAAPQWQNFNAGNWLQTENAVRKLAAKEESTLNIWTGTYGVLKLEAMDGKEKEIYLFPKEAERPAKRSRKGQEPDDGPPQDQLPVPEVFWKLVQHPTKKECTVAVGHNNIHLKAPPTPICSPEEVGWPRLETLEQGYMYYCGYENFKETVDYVPDVDCTGGLFNYTN